MDEELVGENLDREFKVPMEKSKSSESEKATRVLPFDDPTAMKSNILSNLLESLEAQDGSPGPVSTILKEIGVKAPGEIE